MPKIRNSLRKWIILLEAVRNDFDMGLDRSFESRIWRMTRGSRIFFSDNSTMDLWWGSNLEYTFKILCRNRQCITFIFSSNC